MFNLKIQLVQIISNDADVTHEVDPNSAFCCKGLRCGNFRIFVIQTSGGKKKD